MQPGRAAACAGSRGGHRAPKLSTMLLLLVVLLLVVALVVGVGGMTPEATRAIEAVNRSPLWYLKAARTDSGDEGRCVVLRTVRATVDQSFKAVGVDREATLLASGDSSDLLYFVLHVDISFCFSGNMFCFLSLIIHFLDLNLSLCVCVWICVKQRIQVTCQNFLSQETTLNHTAQVGAVFYVYLCLFFCATLLIAFNLFISLFMFFFGGVHFSQTISGLELSTDQLQAMFVFASVTVDAVLSLTACVFPFLLFIDLTI